jgi:hypothetical protein
VSFQPCLLSPTPPPSLRGDRDGPSISPISFKVHFGLFCFFLHPNCSESFMSLVLTFQTESFAPNDPTSSSDGFPTPDNSSPLLLHEHIAKEGRRLDSRSNVPLIALAQRQMSQEHLNEPYAALEDDDTESHTSELSLPVMKALSTISERTELSDPGSRLPSVRRGGTRLTRLTVSQPDRETMTSSYGSVIGMWYISSEPLNSPGLRDHYCTRSYRSRHHSSITF